MRMPIFRLWSVAMYETKLVLRNGAFRALAPVVLFLLAIHLMGIHNIGWFRATPAMIPLRVFAELSLFLAAGAAVLAAERLASDRSVHTSRVFRTRPAADAELHFGKLFGLCLALMGLTAVISAIVAVFTLVFLKETPAVPVLYLLLPLLMTLPQTMYLLGMAFLLDTVTRNRAATLAGLLLYIGVMVFSLERAGHHLYDFRGVRVPLLPSAFTGFGNWGEILGQRGMYLLLGLGLAILALAGMERPPQPRGRRWFSYGITVLLLSGALALGYARLDKMSEETAFRAEIAALDHSLADVPRAALDECRIDLAHRETEIEAVAMLRIVNPNPEPLERYVFQLNPGLEAVEVRGASGPLAFDRRMHALTVIPLHPLAPGSTDSLAVRYRGRIDERACYPDIPSGEWRRDNRASSCTIAKRYAYITPRYVLLTRESLWYPTTGSPGAAGDGFARFALTVRSAPGLTAISQGRMEQTGDGVFRFVPETPLPKISLAIGPYERRKTVVDGVEYGVFVRRGHDFFSRHFRELNADARANVIREARHDLEANMGLEYPFRRFSVVEVPVHFLAHPRTGAIAPETVQPEQAFLPERGAFLKSNPVAEIRSPRWYMIYRQRILSREETLTEALRQFFSRVFVTVDVVNRNTLRMGRQHTGRGGEGLMGESLFEYDCNLFPQFFTFRNGISSEGNPLLGTAFGYYFKSRLPHNAGGGFYQGSLVGAPKHYRAVPVEELVARALSGCSLTGILSEPEKADIAREVLERKSKMLQAFLTALSGVPPRETDTFLEEYLEWNRFRNVPAEELAAALRDRFGIDVFAVLDQWANEKTLPRYTVTGARSVKIPGPDGPVYHVRFTIHNTEPVPGVVRTSMIWGSREEAGDRAERLVFLDGNEAREVGLISRVKSPNLSIDGMVSRHIPVWFGVYLGEPLTNSREIVFTGDRIVDPPRSESDSVIVIVDNLDPGFSILTSPKQRPLERLRAILFPDSGDTDTVLDNWNVPKQWKIGVDNLFYGPAERSAHYIAAGTGEQRVRWEAELPEPGEYDLYYYSHYFYMENNFPSHQGDPPRVQDFHFTVGYDGREEEAVLGYQPVYPWTLLGTFRVENESVRVELSDRTQGRFVYADAIKWVKRPSGKE